MSAEKPTMPPARSPFAPDFFLMDAVDVAAAESHEANLRLHEAVVALFEHTKRMAAMTAKLRSQKPTIDNAMDADRPKVPASITPAKKDEAA